MTKLFHKSKKIGLAALNLQPHGNISLERSVIFLLGELTREQTNEQAGKLKKEKRKEKKRSWLQKHIELILEGSTPIKTSICLNAFPRCSSKLWNAYTQKSARRTKTNTRRPILPPRAPFALQRPEKKEEEEEGKKRFSLF